MGTATRRSIWVIALVVGVVSAAAFVMHRMAPPADPGPVAARTATPGPAVRHDAPVKREAEPVAAQPPADADAIPFAPRIYPSAPLPAVPAPAPTTPAPHLGAPAVPPNAAPAAAAGAAPGFFAQPLAAGTPVSTVLDRLRAAADSGDRDAACRVGIELARCAAGGPLMAATSSGPVVTQAQCAGVSPTEQQSASRYLAQAAQAGSDAARRALAGDASVSPTECGR